MVDRSRPRVRHISQRERRWHFIVLTLLGAAIGAASALLRPVLEHNGVHYEAILADLIILPFIVLVVIVTHFDGRLRSTIPWFSLECAWLYLVRTITWSLAANRWWDDMIGLAIIEFMIAAGFGTMVLLLRARFKPPIEGPYCPACAYCLIGAAEDICPECGRAFTLEELGITREALRVKA